MCQDLDALVVAKNGGIPVGMTSIFANHPERKILVQTAGENRSI